MTCDACGDEYQTPRIQARRDLDGLCPSCTRERCGHGATATLPQSGRRYCQRCGLILERNGDVTPSLLGGDADE